MGCPSKTMSTERRGAVGTGGRMTLRTIAARQMDNIGSSETAVSETSVTADKRIGGWNISRAGEVYVLFGQVRSLNAAEDSASTLGTAFQQAGLFTVFRKVLDGYKTSLYIESMSRSRTETAVTLIVVAAGLFLAGILGLRDI